MRLLSSFDTWLCKKVYEEEKKKHGADKVLLIRRAWCFLFFQVILPLILFFILIFMTIVFVSRLMNILEIDISYNIGINVILIIIWIIAFWFKIIKKFIDYKMDFTIVTPDEVNTYNQSWLFSRSTRTLETATIKSVTIPKTNFWGSLFNYGALIFLAETENDDQEEEQGKWHVKFFFVHGVESARKKALEIIESNWFVIRD